MKIFVAHSSNFDFTNDLYLPLRKSRLNVENEIILPQEGGKEVITKQIIKSCDVVVAEVSYPSTGQGIELGWADVFKVPVVCIYKEAGQISSSSLEKITKTFIAYKDEQDMVDKLRNALAALNR